VHDNSTSSTRILTKPGTLHCQWTQVTPGPVPAVGRSDVHWCHSPTRPCSMHHSPSLISPTPGTPLGVGLEFNTPPDTIYVISEAVITANHLTDTDKQNKYNSKSKQHRIQQNKTTLDQSPFMTRGQEKIGLFYNAPKPTAVSMQYKLL